MSHLAIDLQRNQRCFTIFYGNLNIVALGGAGFASQRTVDDFPEVDLSDFDALVLDVYRSDRKKYTFILKDTVLPKREDGREQSTVSWEYEFECPSPEGSGRIVMHFDRFVPTYRGKPVPNAEPLNLKSIKRFGIMTRSYFGKQEGEFKLFMLSLAAMRYKPRPGSTATGVSLTKTGTEIVEKTSWWSSWLGSLCGRRR